MNHAEEARVRRRAAKLNLALRKSRRDGTFGLIHPDHNCWVAYGDSNDGFGMTLEEVESALNA